jgi:CheY-like chemotaxis protein
MQLPLSILIVDDEEELATLYENFAKAIGLDAVSFTDPLQALEHFVVNSNKYSLVITDLRMPAIGGLELAKRIRELNGSVTIFLITAFDIDGLESSEFYKSATIDKILQKPIKLSVLRNIVEEEL